MIRQVLHPSATHRLLPITSPADAPDTGAVDLLRVAGLAEVDQAGQAWVGQLVDAASDLVSLYAGHGHGFGYARVELDIDVEGETDLELGVRPVYAGSDPAATDLEVEIDGNPLDDVYVRSIDRGILSRRGGRFNGDGDTHRQAFPRGRQRFLGHFTAAHFDDPAPARLTVRAWVGYRLPEHEEGAVPDHVLALPQALALACRVTFHELAAKSLRAAGGALSFLQGNEGYAERFRETGALPKEAREAIDMWRRSA